MGTRLSITKDKKTLTVEATTRGELTKECNRLNQQVDWYVVRGTECPGAEYPYTAVMEQ